MTGDPVIQQLTQTRQEIRSAAYTDRTGDELIQQLTQSGQEIH